MIRHLKKDVLPELPAKTRQLIYLDQPKKLLQFENKHLKQYTLEELLGEAYHMGDVSKYRKECGLAMIKPATEYLIDQLEASKQPLVVFANHIEVVEQLYKNLKKYKPLMIRGGMSAQSKQVNITAFQKDKDCRIIIGNIDSMGVGNTLTKAARTVHVEYSWKWTINEQAEDRVNRIGQDDKTLHTYLVLRNCIHERMLTKIMKKKSTIERVMG